MTKAQEENMRLNEDINKRKSVLEAQIKMNKEQKIKIKDL